MGAEIEKSRPPRGMSKRTMGLIVLAIVSEAAGLLTGHWFFGIYEQTIPPAVITAFNKTTAYGWFLTNGAILGAVFFVWGALSAWFGVWMGIRRVTEE